MIEMRRHGRMRGKHGAALLVLMLCASGAGAGSAAAWGDGTHPAIVRLALETLPPKAAGYYVRYRDILARRVNEPDTVMRARDGRAEEIRHFIDLDAYMPPPFDGFPRDYADAVRRIGKRNAQRYGVLPWVILRFQRQLREAIEAGDAKRVVREAAYLGHYVGDAFQPLHLTKNYDGQFSGSHGVHKRFENDLVDARIDRYLPLIRRQLALAKVIESPRDALFDAMAHSYGAVTPLLHADASARKRGAVGSGAYLRAFDAAAGPLARGQVAGASSMLGSLWLTALRNAQTVGGRP